MSKPVSANNECYDKNATENEWRGLERHHGGEIKNGLSKEVMFRDLIYTKGTTTQRLRGVVLPHQR